MAHPFALSADARPAEQRDVHRQDDHRLGACLVQRPAGARVQLSAGGVRDRRRRLDGLAHVTDILQARVAARIIHME
jgi:hypothetical protein